MEDFDLQRYKVPSQTKPKARQPRKDKLRDEVADPESENLYFGHRRNQLKAKPAPGKKYPKQQNDMRSSLDFFKSGREARAEAVTRSFNAIEQRTVRQSSRVCFNHPRKQAEYRVQVDQQFLCYCKKCAILLASQRFTVTPIEKDTPPAVSRGGDPLRQRQVRELSTKLEEIKPELQRCQRRLEEQCRGMESHFDDMEARVRLYYDEMVQVLEQLRQSALGKLSAQRKKSRQLVDIYRDGVTQQLDELGRVSEDLKQNFSSIINTREVQDENYRPVIQKYSRLAQFYLHKVEEVRGLTLQLLQVEGNTDYSPLEIRLVPFRVHFDEERQRQRSKPPFRNLFCQYQQGLRSPSQMLRQ